VSTDGRIYTFSIRTGTLFHEGGSLQPHDVAYSAHRSMLQGRLDGPQWMAYEALFGPELAMSSIKDFALAYLDKDPETTSFEDLTSEELVQVCEAVKASVVADDAAGTVTYHLHARTAWFLEFLTLPFLDGVTDQVWMATNGDWDGNCATWQNWADPPAEESQLYDRMNGTGPFRFVHWTDEEIRLERFDRYWHGPLWAGGPAGPAALDAVVIRYVQDWATRRDLLTSGQADIVAEVPAANRAELDPFIWGSYKGYQDLDPTLVDVAAGTLRMFQDLPRAAQTPIQLNFQINAETNPYIGSGALDGNGIPSDFFSDLHVRKGFNYAMDWQEAINDTCNGECLRARGPIPAGMLGYSETQPVYPYDPALAAQELQLAWGGQLWAQGFTLTLAYNEGNLTRQRFAEILKAGVEALNPKFHITVISMVWDDLLADLRAGKLPVYVGGWMEDYHHPHNWVHPFLHSYGAYSRVQNFPPALAAQFDAKIEACAQLTDQSAAQTCYEELQNLSYLNAMALWGVQPVDRHYVRTEVQDYYVNPALVGPYYYAFSKGAPPSVEPVAPEQSQTLTAALASGATTTVEMPAGAVDEAGQAVLIPDAAVEESRPGGDRLAGLAFHLQMCPAGECVATYDFGQPVLVTLDYTDGDVVGVLEDQLYLYVWKGSAWVDVVADCGWPPSSYERDLAGNRLTVPLCHASAFALVGGTHDAYLPLVVRND
jgi:peptide/nickel transport system substrate-binding protein